MRGDSFDLIVVGGGTGGLRTAFHAAKQGKRVALIEPGTLGGTCLNRGCIPTKAMLHAAHIYDTCKKADTFGISVSKPKVQFETLMKRVHHIVSVGQSHISQSIAMKNLSLFNTHAQFVGAKRLLVGNKEIEGKKIVIATGSYPRVPPIEGITTVPYLTSADVLQMKKLPRSIGIIGGGYIALEFATFFNLLGVEVTIIGRAPRILSAVDEEISEILTKEYLKRGIKIHTNSEAKTVRKKLLRKEIQFETNGKKHSCTVDEILIAAGRIAQTSKLGLENANVRTTKQGAIQVNSFLETTNPHIYALGDVTGKTMFAHAAKRASNVVLHNSFKRTKKKMPFEQVPWAVFTNPPISGVGLSRRQLKEKKIPHSTLSAPFSSTGRAEIIGETIGIAKVYYHQKSKKILGATLFGARADDMIHEFVALINRNSSIEDLQEIIHVHPTLSEVNGAFHWPA